MKRILLLLALLVPQAFGQATNYTNFIRQIQDGVTKQMDSVAASGSGNAQVPITAAGSLFQLWTMHKTAGTSYLLDWKVVGAYLPSGSVVVATSDRTGDPWGIKRTRIDQPFTVTTTVSGLIPAATGVPEAANKVLLNQHLGLYTNNVANLDAGTVRATTPVYSAYILQNGTTTLNYSRSSFYVVSPTLASGEEHFVLRALADGSLPQNQIAADSVQVWPLATGSITGLTNGQIIKGAAPPLTVTCVNLYPYSTTKVIAFPTSDPTKIIQLAKSEKSFNEKTAQPLTMTLTDYDTALPVDGVYTIQIVTTTPFAVNEPLANIEGKIATITGVVVDKTIKVRAMQVGASD